MLGADRDDATGEQQAEQAAGDREDDDGVERDRQRVIVAAEKARQNRLRRIGQRRAEREGDRERVEFTARRQDYEDAGKADENRAPAADADALAQDQRRHRGHEQRHRERDCDDFGERHRRDREVIAGIRAKPQQTAQQHQAGAARNPRDGLAQQAEQQREQQQRDEAAHEDDLQHRVAVAEVLDDDVLDREQKQAEGQDQGTAGRVERGYDRFCAHRGCRPETQRV